MTAEMWAEIARRLPGVTIDRERVMDALLERQLSPRSPHAADVAWALALAERDPVALARFDRELVPDIRGALIRFGRDDDFVEEAIQRVRVKLLVGEARLRIAEYRGLGSLAAWIQIVAIREALMMQRSTRRETSGGDEQLMQLAITEPVLARASQLYKEAFATAFQRAFIEAPARDRTLLRLCFVEGLATEEIARVYRIHRVTAFRWLRDARESLLEATRKYFTASTEVPSSQLDSVMRSLAESLSVRW